MQNLKVKAATIARIGALVVALINQILAVFGKNLLPFTDSTAYQVISLVATVIIVLVNAWYNNDLTKMAILSGKVFEALNDGKLTEKEIEAILDSLDATTPDEEASAKDNLFVKTINKILTAVKKPKSGE